MEFRFAKLAKYLRGWMGNFGLSELYAPIPEIDHWLRRRVRMCYLKQWRYCRTKVRELTKLETFLHTAISVGLSRKGPWKLSHTLATQSAMTNQWIKFQGLLSAKDLWVNIQGVLEITRLQLGSLWETPSADPHARCCGAGGENPPATRLGKAVIVVCPQFLLDPKSNRWHPPSGASRSA